MSMIFSRYCELLCCCCFPASSACKTTISPSSAWLGFQTGKLTTGDNKGKPVGSLLVLMDDHDPSVL